MNKEAEDKKKAASRKDPMDTPSTPTSREVRGSSSTVRPWCRLMPLCRASGMCWPRACGVDRSGSTVSSIATAESTAQPSVPAHLVPRNAP
jgi:hypothetical protein